MDHLIGQENNLSLLTDLLKNSHFPTSFLIYGPRGSGKKTLAKLVSAAVNCEFGRLGEDCSCHSCHKVETGNHPDVRWLGFDEEAYSIKIEEIHTLINWAGYKVLEGKKKVFIINRAERMTEEAANALLKTLEEPPADTLIFLLVENPANLRETLASRCFKIKIDPLSAEAVKKRLVDHFKWNEKEASLAAKFSRGSLGQALELKGDNVSETMRSFLEEVLPYPTIGVERWIGKKRHEVLKGLQLLSLLLRDLVVYRETAEPALLYQEDFGREFKDWSARLKTKMVLDILRLINETEAAIQDNVNPKIALFRLGTAIEKIYGKTAIYE